jgi:hypothetical protein
MAALGAASCGSDSTSSSSTAAAESTHEPVVISVTVGTDSGEDRVENIPLGTAVKLTVVDPNAEQEYHVHGYELGDGVELAKGEPEVFQFVADKAGEFEVESHKTEAVLLTLKVG